MSVAVEMIVTGNKMDGVKMYLYHIEIFKHIYNIPIHPVFFSPFSLSEFRISRAAPRFESVCKSSAPINLEEIKITRHHEEVEV